MPKYQYLREQGKVFVNSLLLDRLTVKYDSGIFDSAAYTKCGEEAFLIKNYQGSLILVDLLRNGMNKLHIGSKLIGEPHMEVFNSKGEGPRIDLHMVDLKYAQERLQELERWRNEEYRGELAERYRKLGGYFVNHRLKQLKISKIGLEQKIREIEKLVAHLKDQPKNIFVSQTASGIEKEFLDLLTVFDNAAADSRNLSPIISSAVIDFIEQLYFLTKRVFNFSQNKFCLNPEIFENYWQDVDNWENM